jgi:hypothetical protein
MGRIAAPDGAAIPIIRSLTTWVKHGHRKQWFVDSSLCLRFCRLPGMAIATDDFRWL